MQAQTLKSNHCFAVLDDRADISGGGKAGVYFHDTRHLSAYRWAFGPMVLLASSAGTDWAFRHWGLFEDRVQLVSVQREFQLRTDGFDDVLTLTNESDARHVPLVAAHGSGGTGRAVGGWCSSHA